jgi:pimeloyl-ACP methyl ester carboxylesterase
MTAVRTYSVDPTAGRSCVREAGAGEAVGYLAGLGGVPTWLPFLDDLAERRRVVVPSLPGFPGGSTSFHQLDDHLDWLTATLDLLDAAGLAGADLVASSVAAMLAADIAALSSSFVRRLVLIGPWGLYDPTEPGRDYFAEIPDEQPSLLSVHPDRFAEAMAPPADADPVESRIVAYRASEAAARLSWPMGDRGLHKRLHRIRQPTLLVWGEQDAIVPPSYADRFAAGISGPTDVVIVPDAGHLCAVDQPTVTAKHVQAFLDS